MGYSGFLGSTATFPLKRRQPAGQRSGVNTHLLLFTGLLLLVGSGLALVAKKSLRADGVDCDSPESEIWPPVTVIVPATGADAGIASSLRSILNQDYPAFELLLVTRDTEDPAASIIRKEIQDYPFARHICSGKASACGQKNFNLLAGVRAANADSSILVFCDSVRVALPNWLRALVEPIVRNRAMLTTGYHHIIPEDHKMATIGRALTVTVMHLIQSIPWLTQPWGGAAAFDRSTFFELGIPGFWAEQVVDDISLAKLLKTAGVKTMLVAAPWLSTPLPSETLSGWSRWLARQLFYLKISLVGSWIVIGAVCYHMATLAVIAAARGIAGVLGWIPVGDALAAFGFLAGLGALGGILRTFHPSPGPWWCWLMAGYAAPFIAAWSHARTLLTQKIHWRGITYQVDWHGRVEKIQEW
jgi:ceramide glucosyltransferase